jgi:hypothetical protein
MLNEQTSDDPTRDDEYEVDDAFLEWYERPVKAGESCSCDICLGEKRAARRTALDNILAHATMALRLGAPKESISAQIDEALLAHERAKELTPGWIIMNTE